MLWHAIGIKRAGLTDHKATPAGCRERLRETRFYSMCIASSDIDCYNTAAFQGVDVRRVSVTGLPRADVYLHNRESEITHADRFKVLYAPTFRITISTGRYSSRSTTWMTPHCVVSSLSSRIWKST